MLRQLSELTGRSAAVAGVLPGCWQKSACRARSLEWGGGSYASCPVSRHDHRLAEAAVLPSESGVTAVQLRQPCLAQRSANASEDRALTKCADWLTDVDWSKTDRGLMMLGWSCSFLYKV